VANLLEIIKQNLLAIHGVFFFLVGKFPDVVDV